MAGVTKFSDHSSCTNEFFELQTDVDQTAEEFQYMLSMKHIS